ncbi:transglycosylase SLT domain-containing protein [Rhodoligotrophos defluvii]|uniref:transglycosylase SLT domain-containing protein n=1 Tax=Rhodoligotrophos defluvii TaxID=2561934 RepID=UPI0010C9858B|nr:transglycosylase SLT domain-containing protein [Rhodoligotrophos defluvii]
MSMSVNGGTTPHRATGRRKASQGVIAASLALALILTPAWTAPSMAQSTGTFATAVSRTLAGKHVEGQALARQLSSPVERKVVEWLFVQSGSPDVGHERIMAFLAENPHWPQRDLILRRLERAFYDRPPPASVLRAHFSRAQPVSFAGMLALARLYLAEGNRSEAQRWAGKAWRETDFSADGEKKVLAEFGALITDSDHRRRLVRQIYEQEPAAAARTAARISSDHVRLVQAAKALFDGSPAGLKLLSSLPASLRSQPVALYPLVRYYRRAGQEEKARQIAVTVNPKPGELDAPYAWWVEKRLLARYALTPNSPQAWAEAYKLVRSHGHEEGSGLQEGEFLAGWISLRYLKNPRQALPHFEQLRRSAKYDERIAQAEYWLGRTKLALGDQGGAQAHFAAAARHHYTYYGLLARDRLGHGAQPLPVGGAPEVSDSTIARVSRSNDLMAAAQLLANAGYNSLLPQFFSAATSNAKSHEEAAAIATIAWRLKSPHLALRTARLAHRKGYDLGGFAYPVNAIPRIKPITTPVDPALMYAVIRQESEFNPVAVSGAGARGLMQIMPGTAQMVARQHKQSFQPSKLTDPVYSLTLGTAHLSDLVEGFGGSYIMTLVAYNAGPRRVSEWNARFGDPRKGEIDPIDWVEAIPFQETREYVQKIMANVMVYRSRLAPREMRGMIAEISRGGAVPMTASTTAPVTTAVGAPEQPEESVAPAAAECNNITSIASLITCR